MLTLVSGDDELQILNYIKSRKKTFKAGSVSEYTLDKNTLSSFIDFLNASSLFGDKRLVVVKPRSASDIDLKEDFLLQVKSRMELELIVDLSLINKNTAVYKTLKKASSPIEFSKKRDYTGFNISDSLFIKGSVAEALRLLNSIDYESELFQLTGMIHTGLRNTLSMMYKNDAWDSLHPFVKKKTGYSRLSEERVLELYKLLLKLDVDLKSKNVSKRGLMQDFMLYFNA